MPKHTPGCIEWDGAIDRDGYGRTGKWVLAHRVAWTAKFGIIPRGKQIDHICRNRRCVNTDHMELVTQKENILRGIGPTAVNARKRYCSKGHALSGSNLVRRPDGHRECRECRRARWRAYRAREIARGTWQRS